MDFTEKSSITHDHFQASALSQTHIFTQKGYNGVNNHMLPFTDKFYKEKNAQDIKNRLNLELNDRTNSEDNFYEIPNEKSVCSQTEFEKKKLNNGLLENKGYNKVISTDMTAKVNYPGSSRPSISVSYKLGNGKSAKNSNKKLFVENEVKEKEYYYSFPVNQHVLIKEDGEKNFKCHICEKMYLHAFSLKRHFLRNHVSKEYISEADKSNCKIASNKKVKQGKNKEIVSNGRKKRELKGEFLDNNDNCQMPGLYQCSYHNVRYDSDVELRDHFVTVFHSKNEELSCKNCEEAFETKRKLNDHMKTCSNPVNKSNYCKKCNVTFDSNSEYKFHLNYHGNGKLCKYCHKEFSNAANRKRHENLHEGSVGFKCKHCEFSSQGKKELNNHIRKVHMDLYFTCDLCPKQGIAKMYATKNLLESHMEERHGIKDEASQRNLSTTKLDTASKNIPCRKLQNDDTSSNIKLELAIPGTSQSTSVCNLCKKVFPDVRAMLRHKNQAHKKRTTYKRKVKKTIKMKTFRKKPTKKEMEEGAAYYYENVADNVAENLLNHIDGTINQLSLNIQNKIQPSVIPESEFSKFNFSDQFKGSGLSRKSSTFRDLELNEPPEIFVATGLNRNCVNESSITCSCFTCRDSAEKHQSNCTQEKNKFVGIKKSVMYVCSICEEQFNSEIDFDDHCSNNHPFTDTESILVVIEGDKDDPPVIPEYFSQKGRLSFSGILSKGTQLISMELESFNYLKCTKCQVKVSKEYLHEHILKCGGNEMISLQKQPRKRIQQKRIKRTMKHRIDLTIKQKPAGGEYENHYFYKNGRVSKAKLKPGKDYFNLKNKKSTKKHFSTAVKETTPPCSACKKTFSSQAHLKNHLCTPGKKGRKPKSASLQITNTSTNSSVTLDSTDKSSKKNAAILSEAADSLNLVENAYGCNAVIDLSVKNTKRELWSKPDVIQTAINISTEDEKLSISHIDALKETIDRITGLETEKERAKIAVLESNGQSSTIIQKEKCSAEKPVNESKSNISNNNSFHIKKSKKSLDEALKKITKSNSQISDIRNTTENKRNDFASEESKKYCLEKNTTIAGKVHIPSEDAPFLVQNIDTISSDFNNQQQTSLQHRDVTCKSFVETSKTIGNSINTKCTEELNHSSFLPKLDGPDFEDATPTVLKRSRKKQTPSKIILNKSDDQINKRVDNSSLKDAINSKMKDISQSFSKQQNICKMNELNDSTFSGTENFEIPETKLQAVAVQNSVTPRDNSAANALKISSDLLNKTKHEESPVSQMQVQTEVPNQLVSSHLPIKTVESLCEPLPALQAPVLFLSNECQNSELASSQDRDSPTLEVLVSSVTQNLEEFDEHSCLDDDKFVISDSNQNNAMEKQNSLSSSLNFTIIIPENEKLNNLPGQCSQTTLLQSNIGKNFSSDFSASSDILKLDKNYLSNSHMNHPTDIADILTDFTVKASDTNKLDSQENICKSQFESHPGDSCNKTHNDSESKVIANKISSPVITVSENTCGTQNASSNSVFNMSDQNKLNTETEINSNDIFSNTKSTAVNSTLEDNQKDINVPICKRAQESLTDNDENKKISKKFDNEKSKPSSLNCRDSSTANNKLECSENMVKESNKNISKSLQENTTEKCIQKPPLPNQEKEKSLDAKKIKSPTKKRKMRTNKSDDCKISSSILTADQIETSAVSHLRAFRRSQSESFIDASETNSALMNNSAKDSLKTIRKADCQKDKDKSSLNPTSVVSSENDAIDLHQHLSSDSFDKEQVSSNNVEVMPSVETGEPVVIKKETDGAKKHSCPYCRLEFAYLTNFRRHMRQCRGNSELRHNEQPSSSTPHLLHHLPKKEEVAESMLNLLRHQIRQNQMKQEVEKNDTETNKDAVSNEPKKLQTYTCPFCHRIFLKLFERVKHLTNVHLLSNEESKVYMQNQNYSEQKNIDEANTNSIQENNVNSSDLLSNHEENSKCTEQDSIAVKLEGRQSNSIENSNSSNIVTSLPENVATSNTKDQIGVQLNVEDSLHNVMEKKELLKHQTDLEQNISEENVPENLNKRFTEVSENSKTKTSSKNHSEVLQKIQLKNKGNSKVSNSHLSEVTTNSYPSRNKELISKRKSEFLDPLLYQLPSYGQGRGRKKSKLSCDPITETNSENISAVETSKEVSLINSQDTRKLDSKSVAVSSNAESLKVNSKKILVNKLKDTISNKMKLLASKSISIHNSLQSCQDITVNNEKKAVLNESKKNYNIANNSVSLSSTSESKTVDETGTIHNNDKSIGVQSSIDEKKSISLHILSAPKRGRKRKPSDIVNLNAGPNIVKVKKKEQTKENKKTPLPSEDSSSKTSSVSYNKPKSPATVSPRRSRLPVDSSFYESDSTNSISPEKNKHSSLDKTKVKGRRGPKPQSKIVPAINIANSSLPSTSDSVYSQMRQPRKSKRSTHCDSETGLSPIVRQSTISGNHSDSDDFVSSPEKDLIKKKRSKKIPSKNVCLICKKKFTTSLERNRHMQLVHRRKNISIERDLAVVEMSSNDKSLKKESDAIKDRSSFQRQCAKPLPPLKRKYEKHLQKTLKFKKTK